MADTDFDAVIIGAGQGASPFAQALGRAGWKTAVVERRHAGGSCVNFGCTPTKTLVASARVAWLARRGTDFGVRTGPVSVDMAALRRRKRDMVERFRDSVEAALRDAKNVEYIAGHATFAGPREIDVTLPDGGLRRLSAPRVFIDTGTRAARPPIAGLDDVPVHGPGSIMELGELPEHLLIIGGGYVGLEFAQMFRRFGSRVSVVQRGSQLLEGEDPDVAEAVLGILEDDGIDIHLQTEVAAMARGNDRNTSLELEAPAGRRKVDCTHVLLAAGRTPNTDDLNLSAAGVATDEQGYIRVNDSLETSVEGVYALGDVKGGPAFTHVSYDDYRVLAANLLEGREATISDRLLPYTMYIDPQLGRLGMTEAAARQAGRSIRVARLPMENVSRAIESGQTRGFMKVVVDADSGQILGCAILAMEGGEIMSVLQVAMMGGIRHERLRDAMFAHPTLAESLNSLFARLE